MIAGIYSLHDFYSKPLHRTGGLMRRSAATGKWAPADQTSPQFFTDVNGEDYELITPYDFATIYNVLPLWNATSPIDGTGQKVAIAGRSDILLTDVATFRSDFGLPVNAPTVIVNGPDPGVPTEGDQIENTLDVEWSGAVAKGATIVFVTSKNTSNSGGDFLSDEYIVDNDVAPVMSSSYGNCELNNGVGGNAAINSLWQQAATEGIAVFISAGDQGSAGCDSDSQTPPDSATEGLQVNGLASTPYDVAVGGTDFDYVGTASTYWNSTNAPTTQASAKGYVPEIPWNLTCTNPVIDTILGFGNAEATCNHIKTSSVDTFLLTVGGGSGGVSACTTPSGSTPSTCAGGYAKPTWQIGTGVPADGQRDLPDVSLFAANGLLGSAYLVCVSSASPDGTCSFNNTNDVLALSVGGTSVSSPAMAGVMALVNQKMGTPQGEPNSVFYQLAALDTLANCNASTVGNGSACIFYDTTSGTNAMPCTTGSQNCTTNTGGDTIGVLSGYSSTTGYDLTTGLGSANVANLVNGWSTVVTTPAVATTLTYNGPTTFTNGSAANLSAVLTRTTGGSAVVGVSVLFTLGSGGAAQTCSGITGSNGTATCVIASVSQTVGAGVVTAVFAGNASYLTSTSGPLAVTILAAPAVATTLAYNGPTTFTNGSAANLSAVLTQTTGGSAVVGVSVLFTLGSGGTAQTCSGTTNSSGTAACSITTVNQTVGASSVRASFAGNASYLASTSGPIAVTILAAPAVATTLTYTGPTTFTNDSAANLSAVLTQTSGGNPVVGVSIVFTLGSGGTAQTCSGTTNSSGTATCTIASVHQTAGSSTDSESFAGNASDQASSGGPTTVTIAAAPAVATTLTYNGPTTFTDGSAANLSAVLTQTTGGSAVAGVSVLFTLGSGSAAQTCSGTTNSAGTATCSIPRVSQVAGSSSVSASFAGNASDLASSAGPVTVTIVAAATTLTYTGPATFTNGNAANLSAVLTQTTGGSAVVGVSVSFTVGSGGTAQTCSGITSSNGTAACMIASVNQTAGLSTVSASFAGNATELASSAGPLTVTIVAAPAVATTLTYNGPTIFTIGGAANLSAVLTQTTGGSAVAGVSVLFTLGSGGTAQTCSGTTGSSGAATCSIATVNQTAGADTVSAMFAGNASDLASTTGSVAVTISAAPAAATTLIYNGPTTFTNGSTANLSAALTKTTGGNPIVGVSVLFTLGSGGTAQTCSGVTGANGTAACSISSVNQNAGASTVSASFAGNASFLASSAGPVTVTIVAGATTLTYNGPTIFTNGSSATLSAVLTFTTGGGPVAGVSILFTLGSGGTAQTCSGITSATGAATCTITTVNQTAGSRTVSASFAGNSMILVSSAGPITVTIVDFTVSFTTGPLTVVAGGSAMFTITTAPVGGDSAILVTFTATGLPAETVATFSPVSVTPGGSTTMTVMTTPRPVAAMRTPISPRGPQSPRSFPVSFPAWLASLAIAMLLAGVGFAGFARKPLRRLAPVAALILLIVTAGYIAGCAGNVAAVPTGTPAGTYTITVTGTSGTDVHSTSVTLVVQ